MQPPDSASLSLISRGRLSSGDIVLVKTTPRQARHRRPAFIYAWVLEELPLKQFSPKPTRYSPQSAGMRIRRQQDRKSDSQPTAPSEYKRVQRDQPRFSCVG